MFAFTFNVNALVVEQCLLNKIPEGVFDSHVVSDMDRTMVNAIAREDEGIVQRRKKLSREAEIMTSALAILQKFIAIS